MNMYTERHDLHRKGYLRARRVKKCAAEFIAQGLKDTAAACDYPEDGAISVEAPTIKNPQERLVIANWLCHHPESAIVFINRALSGAGATEEPAELITNMAYQPDENHVLLHLSEESYISLTSS